MLSFGPAAAPGHLELELPGRLADLSSMSEFGNSSSRPSTLSFEEPWLTHKPLEKRVDATSENYFSGCGPWILEY